MSAPTPEPGVANRLLLPLLLVLALVLAGWVGLGIVGGLVGPPLPGRPGTTPSLVDATTVPPEGEVTLEAGRLVMPPWVECRLPGAPFVVDGGPTKTTSVNGLFDDAALVFATLDPHYVKDQNWPPGLVAGSLEPRTAVRSDLPASTAGVLREFTRRLYRQLAGLQLGQVKLEPPATVAGYAASRGTLSVTGRLADGTQQEAEVALLLLQVRNDRWFAFAEIRPSTISPDLAAALDVARESIKPWS